MRRYTLTRAEVVRGLHFTPCGTQLLAVAGASSALIGAAQLLDVISGDPLSNIEQYGSGYAVPPDVSRFVLFDGDRWDNNLRSIVWADLPDLTGWKCQTWPKRSLPPQYRGVGAMAFDPSGARLAVAHARGFLRGHRNFFRRFLTIIKPETGEPRTELPAPRHVHRLCFNSDGTRLATAGCWGDAEAIVYDLAARAEVYQFKPPGKARTLALLFLPEHLLAVANDNIVFVLHADGTQQFALRGHTQLVNALALTPDGTRLLSASHDGTVRVWDLRTGETVAAFDWKIGPVTALACAPDGLTCAAAGTGGNVVLWDADG